MSVVNWTHEQIPAWDISSQAWVDNAEQIDKDNEMWGSIPWADVAPKGETDLIRNARIYRDIDPFCSISTRHGSGLHSWVAGSKYGPR